MPGLQHFPPDYIRRSDECAFLIPMGIPALTFINSNRNVWTCINDGLPHQYAAKTMVDEVNLAMHINKC